MSMIQPIPAIREADLQLSEGELRRRTERIRWTRVPRPASRPRGR